MLSKRLTGQKGHTVYIDYKRERGKDMESDMFSGATICACAGYLSIYLDLLTHAKLAAAAMAAR